MFPGRLYPYRALIVTLVLKEMKARYRGSVLGFLWTFLNPLIMMLVYTFVFSVTMRVDMKNYHLFVFAGLLPWLWFASSFNQASMAIIREGSLLKKVVFPAEILPLVTVSATGINFLLSLPLYLVFALAARIPLGWPLLFLPLIALLAFMLLYGFALFLSAATVAFRDVEHLTINLVTLLFFLTPILYAETWIPPAYRFWALLNPAAALVVSCRDILFHNRAPATEQLATLAVWALLLWPAGRLFFRLQSHRFAEEV